MYKIEISKDVEKSLAKIMQSDPTAYKKWKKLYIELEQHPREGTGHPEPLVGGNNVTYSRRLTKKDRVIYNVYDDVVLVTIISVEGHYGDK